MFVCGQWDKPTSNNFLNLWIGENAPQISIKIIFQFVRIEKEKKNDAIINNLRVLTPFAYEIVINYK